MISGLQQQQKLFAQHQARQVELDKDPINANTVYNSLNKERAAAGASALSTTLNLTIAAEQMCADMSNADYFDYKNPTSGKEANSFITDNAGDLYLKRYVSSIFRGDLQKTAAEVVREAVAQQASNLTNPEYNSVGVAVCDSAHQGPAKLIVAMLANKQDPPAAPAVKYVPQYSPPAYSPTTCNTQYYSGFGYMGPSATTRCY